MLPIVPPPNLASKLNAILNLHCGLYQDVHITSAPRTCSQDTLYQELARLAVVGSCCWVVVQAVSIIIFMELLKTTAELKRELQEVKRELKSVEGWSMGGALLATGLALQIGC
jgi:flagellar biosynthesis protein FlhB